MRRRAGIGAILAATLAVVALGGPAAAGRPEILLDVGRTLAVDGEPNGGGASFGLSFLWRLEDHVRAGVVAVLDDLGEETERLIGPSGEDLGPVAGVHRAVKGAAVRLQAHLAEEHAFDPYLAATWGLYRVEDDVRGATVGSDDAVGFSLGAGILRPLNEHHAAGVSMRAQWLSRGGAGHYLGAALEWRWSMGAGD